MHELTDPFNPNARIHVLERVRSRRRSRIPALTHEPRATERAFPSPQLHAVWTLAARVVIPIPFHLCRHYFNYFNSYCESSRLIPSPSRNSPERQPPATCDKMADYGKKKNDELAALCKERGLAHTGKKADLVKRLEEYDTTSAGTPAKPPAAEDEIDWDDEPATETAKAATSEPAPNAIAAGGVGEVSNPQAVPNQEAAIDPAKTDDLAVAPPAAEPAATEEKKEEPNFSTGLAERTLDEEIEKRKARARKFGLPEDSDEIKMLERAKRFGNNELPGLGLLNKALPEKTERKRGREGGDSGRPGPGKKQRGDKPERKDGVDGFPSWMTQADRDAAARRKAKFTA